MQSILKKVIWACLLIVPFVALYVASGHSLDIINWGTSGLYFPFISGKNLLFRLLVEIAFFSWIALALADPAYRLRIRKSPVLLAYGIFMGVLLLADLFGINPSRSFWSNFERMEGYAAHLHFFAYFIVLSAMLHTAADYGRMFKYLVASNIAVLVFGYGQLLGANGYIFSKLVPSVAAKFSQMFPVHMSENRLDATLGNSAYFAIYCLTFVFILGLLWLQERGRNPSKLYPVLIALNLIALFYTGTRGTQIGLVVGMLVAAGILVFRWTDSRWQLLAVSVSSVLYSVYLAVAMFANNALFSYFKYTSYAFAAILLVSALTAYIRIKDKMRKAGAGVFVAIIAAILLFQPVKHTAFVQGSPTLARLANISPTDLTGMSRLSIWKISYEAWKERPLLGYGQENFTTIYAERFVPEKMWNLEPWYDRSHDVFFDWLVAAGLLGLLAYLALYVVALYLMWVRKNDMPFQEKAILTGFLAGYFVHNIFVFDNLFSYILFFFILSYVAWRTGTRGGAEDGKVIAEDQLRMVYLPVIGIVALVSLFFMIYRPLQVNKLIVEGIDIGRHIQKMSVIDLVNLQKESFTKAVAMDTLGSLEAREQFMQTASRMAQVSIPSDVSNADRVRTQLAINSFVEAAHADIQASFERYVDDPRMLSIFGTFYNDTGNGILAESILKRAHDIAPKKQLISFDLTRAYLIQGKMKEAYALALETYELAPAYGVAVRAYLFTAAYAGRWQEAHDRIVADGGRVPFDPDILNVLITTNQKSAAIEFLNDFKRRNPEYAAQIDAYVQDALAGDKK